MSLRIFTAGIIDGEGSVTLGIKQKGATEHLAVSVSNTDRQLLEFILKKIGAGIITNKRIYKTHHTPSYTYCVYGRQALDVLRQVTPYLRTYKRTRAQFVIKHYISVTPRNGKYSADALKKRQKFVASFFRIPR